MKIKWSILAIFLFTTVLITAQTKNMKTINTIINSVKVKYAPDKRVALFNVEIKKEKKNLILTGETNIPEAKGELMDKINSKKIKVKDEIVLLPDEKLGDKVYGIVNLSVANIRTYPKHPAELATQALLGTIVKVLKHEDGFYLIQTPDEYIAWVDDDGIVTVNRDLLYDWESTPKIIYTKDYGFAYISPDEESQRVSDLVIGDILINIGEEGDYVKVQYPDKRIAFIKKEYTKSLKDWLATAKPTQENIIETAKSFMGIPYLWGGTSAKGMDCSGFTKTVYFLNGVLLDRDASQQVKKGILVDTENGFENLQKGDLLFFGFKGTKEKKERVTHVGIYIGDLEFIHESGRVKINSFDKKRPNFSKFRLEHFIRARRIITSLNKNGIIMIKDSKYYNGEL
jgi:cell wall-associated NlpC family hydrolase